MNELVIAKEFNQPLSEIRETEFEGSVSVPGIRELLSIIWNGGEIEFTLERDGLHPFDWIGFRKMLDKKQDELKDLKNDKVQGGQR